MLFTKITSHSPGERQSLALRLRLDNFPMVTNQGICQAPFNLPRSKFEIGSWELDVCICFMIQAKNGWFEMEDHEVCWYRWGVPVGR
jgi:hypothetical protein